MIPQRIQLRRSRGWRKPEGAVVVARPSRFGNPYEVGAGMVTWSGLTAGDVGFYGNRRVSVDQMPLHSLTADEAVQLYRDELLAGLDDDDPFYDDLRQAVGLLRGHDLACWCPLEDEDGGRIPCHADVLLAIANGDEAVG